MDRSAFHDPQGCNDWEGAVVGCCYVVTKDVEPYTVVAGNPARPVKRLGNLEADE